MKPIIPGLLILIATQSLQAAPDPARGRQLHDTHCLQCHDTSVYTRENRRIHDMQGLEKQVRRCELSLGLRWFDEDVDSVVRYLDDNFYHFGK